MTRGSLGQRMPCRPWVWVLAACCAMAPGACDWGTAAIAEQLGRSDPALRARAVARVAERGRASDVKLIAPLLRDPSARVRRAAVAAVGTLGPKGKLHALIDCLRDDDLQVRLAAVRVIGDVGGAGARRALLSVLRDASMVVRRAAENALEGIGVSPEAQASEIARQHLEDQVAALAHADAQVRANAARELGLGGFARAVPPLVKRFDDRSPRVLLAAAQAVGRIGGKAARDALVALTRQPAPEARAAAAAGAAELATAPPAAVAGLVRDEAPVVRGAALRALAKNRRCPAVTEGSQPAKAPPACAALLDDDLELVDAAAALVAVCPGACGDAVGHLIEAASSSRGERASALHRALARLAGEATTRELVAYAREQYRVYIEQVEAWIPAARWRELDPPSAQSRPVTPSKAPPARSRRKAADWLLSRYPNTRGDDAEQALLPPQIDVAAIVALIRGLAGRPLARSWLTELAAADSGDPLRLAALEALGAYAASEQPPASKGGRRGAQSPGAAAASVLRAALDDRRGLVRRSALRACQSLGAGVTERALRLLGDGDFEVRVAAAGCLGRLRATAAVPRLLEALASERALDVIEALGAIGDRRATAPIAALLQEDFGAEREDERLAVIQALGALGDPAAGRALARELTHPAWRVRLAAAKALASNGAAAKASLRRCGHDYFAEVRAACQAAAQEKR